jgi:hypothetical protein
VAVGGVWLLPRLGIAHRDHLRDGEGNIIKDTKAERMAQGNRI